MSYNTIFPLPKEYDTLNEKVRKTSGDLDHTKQALVTTTNTVVKEQNTEKLKKKGDQNLMLWRKPSLLLFQKNRKLT